MDLSIVFLGTAASAPTARRGVSALAIRRGGDVLLVDCGEGTQRQMIRSIGLADLEHIFITHFHADHILGLPGMLKTFALRGRELPLTIYGPPGLMRVMADLQAVYGRLPYEVRLRECQPRQPIAFDGYAMVPFAVKHNGAAYGWALVEEERPGRFNEQRAIELGVKPGPDFGKLQRGEEISVGGAAVKPDDVLGEGRAGRKVVISGDTAPCDELKLAAHGADLLVHEASFGEPELERAAETNHSTAAQAAAIAKRAEVKLLCLTHVSNRYLGRELLEEAREVFENTELPGDFDAIEVPFAERGEPVLVKNR